MASPSFDENPLKIVLDRKPPRFCEDGSSITESYLHQQRLSSIRVRELLAEIRTRQIKRIDGPVHWAVMRDGYAKGHGLRAVIGIPTRGCSYARSVWGGCSVCGHVASTLWDDQITSAAMLEDFTKSLSEVAMFRPPILCLYTSGSFLDDTEIDRDTRARVLQRVATFGWVKEIFLESLPQFVTEEALRLLRSVLPCVKFTIGMGLDSSHDYVRRVCFQRHISDAAYLQAVHHCRNHNVDTTAYLVHKHPFLTLAEAVSDTAQSILDAVGMGFTSISIEPVALQSGTLQNHLAKRNLFEVPSVWSVASAVSLASQRLNDKFLLSRVYLGGQVFTPLPDSSLRACQDCVSNILHEMPQLPRSFFDGLPMTIHSVHCGASRVIDPLPVDPAIVAERIAALLDSMEVDHRLLEAHETTL